MDLSEIQNTILDRQGIPGSSDPFPLKELKIKIGIF